MQTQDESLIFDGRVGLQQRVFPAYRAPFFDTLTGYCRGGLSVFAGEALPDESIGASGRLFKAQHYPARNWNFFPIQSPIYQCWQANLLTWLKAWDPEALIVEANTRYPSTRLAVRWMHARRRPVIGWGLGAPPLLASSLLDKLVQPWRQWERVSLLRSLDGMIAYSRRGADEYQALGIPPGRIFIAPNAAAAKPEQAPPERPAAFADRPAVLFVGRLQARKRIDLLLKACAALPEPLQPRVWIVGDGPARDDFETQAREEYPYAEFPGALRGDALKPYFAAADLFVLPGTGGLAVQQAMAHGLPVIVAEGDGTQDDLVRQENGWIVPPGDLPALTQTLQQALSDAARLRQMGRESFRIAAEEVNLEAMAQAFIKAINTVFYLKKVDLK